MEIESKKQLRFIDRCISCRYEKVVDLPPTSTSHKLLISMGFELIDGIYTNIEKFDCGHSKVKP